MTAIVPRDNVGGRPEALTLLVGPRELLVVAGLPGAGKSTVLRRLRCRDELVVLDSDQVRDALRSLLPAGVPYRWYRPLVHLVHRLRIVAAAVTAPGPLVVHEPTTRVSTRAMFVVLGVLTRRPRGMLWLDVSPTEALAGQQARGRMLSARSFGRHVRRAALLLGRLRDGRAPTGWQDVVVLTRPQVTGGLHIVVDADEVTGARRLPSTLGPVPRAGYHTQ
ncbi:MAG TPA: AAA family ATPase [Pseudonocardiaceae bacterium]